MPEQGLKTPEHRVGTTGEWTIAVAPGFRQIDNGDSWQAYQGERVVYVSSIVVRDAGGSKTPAESLCATAARTLDPETDRFRHSGPNARGEAQIKREADHWQLKGFMCVAGILATCVIDYASGDEEWAIATWRSLEHP
jgi:hypothetical protein